MKGKKRKIPTTILSAKRPGVNKTKKTRGLKQALKTKVSFGRILCVLTAFVRLVQGGINGKCLSDKILSSSNTKTFYLGNCANGQNSFTFFSYLRKPDSSETYPKDSELRTYLRYFNKIYLRIQSFGAGKDEEVQVFKTDEGATPIMRPKISMDRRSKLIFFQVTNTKATLAVRSYFNARFDNHNNHEVTFSKISFEFIIILLLFFCLELI